MNTNYRKDPIEEEIDKNTGTFNLTVTVEKDTNMRNEFKHIQNFVAFKATLRKGDEVIGIGTGAAVLNRLNKFVERTVRFAYNASLVDAMVRSTKILDALYITPNNQKIDIKDDEEDLEGRDRQTFFNDEDMPQVATEKQRTFLTKLLVKCDNSTKEKYLNKLESPYLSKFDCSKLINELMPVK